MGAATSGKGAAVAAINKLNAKAVESATHQTARKISDGGGLYLELLPRADGTTSKRWRMKYRVAGRERSLSIGTYPEVSLKQAREARDDAKAKLRQGIDPAAEKQKQKAALAKAADSSRTLGAWVSRYEAENRGRLAPVTLARNMGLLDRLRGAGLYALPLVELTPALLLKALQKLQADGLSADNTHRLKQNVSRIFRMAALEGQVETDPTALLKGALGKARDGGHYPFLQKLSEVQECWQALSIYEARSPWIVDCLRFAILNGLRSGTARGAKWEHIDLKAGIFHAPPEIMKAGSAFRYPLAPASIELLERVRYWTAGRDLVFPGLRSGRPLSDNSLNAILRSLGYTKDQVVVHGFRSSLASIGGEQGLADEAVIDAQLAHTRSGSRKAYFRSDLLEPRRALVEAWARLVTDAERPSATV